VIALLWPLGALLLAAGATFGVLSLTRKPSTRGPGVSVGVGPVNIPKSREAERLEGLLPDVRAALALVRVELGKLGIQTLVGETRRTEAQQAGRVSSGNSATVRSWHRLGRAVDLYPLLPSGLPDWSGSNLDAFRKMHEIAKKNGFQNLAFNPDGSRRFIKTNKGKLWDGGHIEFPGGKTFAQAAQEQGIRIA
jgi:hypothetical protein